MKKFKKNNYQLKSLFFAIVLLFDIRAVNSQTPAEIIGDQFIYTNKNIKQENSNQDNQLNLSQQNSKNKEVAVKSPQNNYSQTLNDTTKQVNLDLNKIAKTIDNNKSKDINKTKSKILEKKKNISIGKKSSEGEVIAVLKKEAKNLSPLEINKNKYLELEAEFDRNSQNIEPQSRNNDMFLSKEPPSPIIANNIRTL
ncbi:MAG: hypothetical protein LW595_05895 [Rickettsiales bacterium]|nr:hypothetical protein [Rickettsiales bacterium]